jgi:hypothetical protein
MTSVQITSDQAKQNILKYRTCQTKEMQQILTKIFNTITTESLLGKSEIYISLDSDTYGKYLVKYLTDPPYNYNCSFKSSYNCQNESSHVLTIIIM